MAKFELKTMPGIERPAIAGVWPTINGKSIVLDLGASIGADAKHLMNLAAMGSAMARVLLGIERRRSGPQHWRGRRKGLEEVRRRLSCCAKVRGKNSSITDLWRATISERVRWTWW